MADGTLSGNDAYLAGKPCPKCGHARIAADTNPEWQCPKCHIAYAKFTPRPPLVTRLAEGARELTAEGLSDRSVYALIAANLFAATMALAFKLSLSDLMLVYWAQSVFIGLSFLVRILCLDEYSTEGLQSRDAGQIDETTPSKGSVAAFFLVHYGIFHVGYLLLVLLSRPSSEPIPSFTIAIGACGLAFAANHLYSLFHNVRADRAGRPNLGTLTFLPYFRVVPMHLTIMFSIGNEGRTEVLLMFIVLKTVADVGMHVVEHRVLRAGKGFFLSPADKDDG